MEHESDVYSNCNWCSWYSHQRFDTGIRGINTTAGDHQNYHIIKISHFVKMDHLIGASLWNGMFGQVEGQYTTMVFHRNLSDSESPQVSKHAIPKWCTGRKWHILMASNRKISHRRIWLTKWDKVKPHDTLMDWCTEREWPVNCMTVISAWWRSNMPFHRLSGRLSGWLNYYITRWRQEVSELGIREVGVKMW